LLACGGVVLVVLFLGDLSYVVHLCSRVSCSTSRWYGALRTRVRRQGPSSEAEADATLVLAS
jgi:hypothetical protein